MEVNFCIQINKEADIVLDCWIKETGLASLGRSGLFRKSLGHKHVGESYSEDSAHKINTHT
jgi:hypothetical protein